MDERSKAVSKAKIGFLSIAGMLIVNILLASFIFFDVSQVRSRELFLAIGTLMALIYAVTFPTKLMPSGAYLIRNIILLMLPIIVIELICSVGMGAVAIVGYVIGILVTAICTYICVTFHRKVVKFVKEENYNDYILFEHKTFKVQEINLYSVAFIFINFFILIAAYSDLALTIVIYINLLVGITLNYYRTKGAKGDKVKMSYFVLESICTLLAYTLVVVVHALELSTFINIGAMALLVPTVVMTVLVYKSLDNFMHM